MVEEEECLRLRLAEIISHDIKHTKQSSGGNLYLMMKSYTMVLLSNTKITNRLPYGVVVYIVYIIPKQVLLPTQCRVVQPRRSAWRWAGSWK